LFLYKNTWRRTIGKSSKGAWGEAPETKPPFSMLTRGFSPTLPPYIGRGKDEKPVIEK